MQAYVPEELVETFTATMDAAFGKGATSDLKIRPVGAAELGTKVEIKNMNSFSGIHAALLHEARRQRECVIRSIPIVQETRRWDADALETASMRTKENAHDYRYFPEPDLVPVELDEALVEEWRKSLPEKPEARRARMVEEYGIAEYDAEVLSQHKVNADYFEAAAKGLDKKTAKALCNLFMSDVMALINATGKKNKHDVDNEERHGVNNTHALYVILARLTDMSLHYKVGLTQKKHQAK